MCHKAYAFDWYAFERDELYEILFRALKTNDTAGLYSYIEANRCLLKDPYEGEPLDENWRSMLENRDVHELGDFALTRFYNPAGDYGVAESWIDINDALPKYARGTLLGFPFGPRNNLFDPGRMGSYFQTPVQVLKSLTRIRRVRLQRLEDYQREHIETFQALLEECVSKKLGLYTTF